MKTLILLRHAKSSQNIEEISDIDRPLNERGYRDAKMMSEIFKKEQIPVSKIISSPAIRALSTALVFSPALKIKYSDIGIDENLYGKGKDKVVSLIKSLDDKFDTVMITGHNPDFEDTLNSLVRNKIEKFSTTGIAVIEFKVKKWSEINLSKSKLVKLLLPSQYRGERIQNDEN